MSRSGIASRQWIDGVLSKVLRPGAWFGSGMLGLVEPGLFLWCCAGGRGLGSGTVGTGQWVGVGPSGGTSCTDGEPGRWDRVDVQVDRLQHLVEKGIVRPGTSRRAGSSAFLSLCGDETIGSRPHQARPHRQRRRRRRPPEVLVKTFATSRRTTTLVPGAAAPSQRGDRDDSMGFRRLVNG